MLLTEYLLTKAAEEADELATAFVRGNIFGLFSDKEGKTPAQEAGEEINDIMTFVAFLREEGLPIERIGDTSDLEWMKRDIAEKVLSLVGENGSEEAILCKLLDMGAEKAMSLVKSFTKALTFGIDSIDPKTELTARDKIGKCLNDVMSVLRVLDASGVKIPGIGDGAYMLMRREKAIQGAIVAQERGIICPKDEVAPSPELPPGSSVSTEQGNVALVDAPKGPMRYNGGVYQSPAYRTPMEDPFGVNQQTGGREDIDKVVYIVYGCPSGGDAAPNDIVMIDQGKIIDDDGSRPCSAVAVVS